MNPSRCQGSGPGSRPVLGHQGHERGAQCRRPASLVVGLAVAGDRILRAAVLRQRAHAARADGEPAQLTADHHLLPMHVCPEVAVGPPLRVAHVVAKNRRLSANLTARGHRVPSFPSLIVRRDSCAHVAAPGRRALPRAPKSPPVHATGGRQHNDGISYHSDAAANNVAASPNDLTVVAARHSAATRRIRPERVIIAFPPTDGPSPAGSAVNAGAHSKAVRTAVSP